MSLPQLPVIIVGAGIVGLALAQALKKAGIPFLIYERDQHIDARPSGWGISVSCAALETLLASALPSALGSIQVDPHQRTDIDTASVFLNLETGETAFEIPPGACWRVSRGKLRELLARGIDVNWGKSVSDFRSTAHGVSVCFSDGTGVEGAVLAAADGGGSKVRRLLLGDDQGNMKQLPVRCLAFHLRLTREKAATLLAIDPLLCQGNHPGTGTYVFFALLSTPERNGTLETDSPRFEVQLEVSWLVNGPQDEVPESNAERLAKIKGLAKAGTGLITALRETIEDIPDDTTVLHIKVADWPTVPWNGLGGRVTLLGDAAHPMTQYRGGAATHGFTDATNLTEQLRLWYQGSKNRQEALADFEAEMMQRGHEAVLLSRQACLDAHDLRRLTPDSSMVNRDDQAV
ncbi:FAD binding domain-containing protein [Podospora appendiculata]|uniref:FAD binding domain-containing protein n=1 Tax=Podospora appendiculata TaxID=314037 RepID=A0AAE1C7B9_9PEZI|nr:FAD binding domain-containing protein [Podospora appendiculata]